jgi:hypothetical protein
MLDVSKASLALRNVVSYNGQSYAADMQPLLDDNANPARE